MKRRGFKLIELLVLIASFALLIFVLTSCRTRRNVRSAQFICAANLRGLGQSCKIYANDFNESWPIAPHQADKFTGLSPIGTHRLDGDRAHPDPSVGESFWLIIKSGGTTNRQFICPMKECTDESDRTANPMTYFDFEFGYNLSYGYQYPYGPSKALPTEALDPGTPMIADKCFKAVGPTVRGAPVTTFDDWGPARWKPYNSRNHSSEGQNVLYADGHASYEKRPACGLPLPEFPRGTSCEHNDLIYENRDGIPGGLPGGWPLDANDSVIVHSPIR